MGLGPRTLLIAVLLVATISMAVAQKDGAEDHTYWKDSECWTCHKPGAWSPDMDPLLNLVPTRIDLQQGDVFELEVSGVNAWQASNPTNQLLDWRVGLDISGAPSLAFVSDTPPFETSLDGSIEYDPTALPAPPALPAITDAQQGHVAFQMPSGATEAVVRVIPSDSNPTTGPNLGVNIYTGTTEPFGEPDVELSPRGKGATVVGRFLTQDFGELGFGNWTVEAETTPVPLDGTVPAFATGSIGFRVEVDAWFNASAQTFALDAWSPGVVPGQLALFSWDLQAQSAPGLGEFLRFTTNVTIHYVHDGSEPDWWEFSMDPIDVPIDVGAGTATIGSDRIGPRLTEVNIPGVSLAAISEAVGYAAGFLMLASIYTGGMFGKRSRRQLNTLFGNAKRRVAFHNFLSYGIIAAAIAHTILFIIEVNYHWTVGLIWGGLGVLALFALGVTGAIQVPMIRRWNYAVWRWSHFYLAIAAIVFTVIHLLLDGQNFHMVQDALNYTDPIVPADRQ